MDERTLSRVIEILENAPDFFVPVKKLWLTLQGEGLALDVDLPDFYNMLLNNGQFELASGVDHEEGFDDPAVAEEMENEMESLGFYSGPRVKLVSREMTAEDIFVGLARSLKQMNKALQNAWDSRPEDHQETEDQLLEILAAGQKLEREVRGLIEGHERGDQDEDQDRQAIEAAV